jgi:hypothetical protein
LMTRRGDPQLNATAHNYADRTCDQISNPQKIRGKPVSADITHLPKSKNFDLASPVSQHAPPIRALYE